MAPAGRVPLGTYGLVYVTGMTLEETKAAIDAYQEYVKKHPRGSKAGMAMRKLQRLK